MAKAKVWAMAGTDDGEGEAFAKTGVGEALNRIVRHTKIKTSARWAALPHEHANETKQKEGKWATGCLVLNEARPGVLLQTVSIKQVR